jgi:site-specific DNA-adenine methylase
MNEKRATQWFPWNGSKRWLLPRLSAVIGEWSPGSSGRFIDPFCGGGSVSALVRHEHPAVAQVLSDANPWLMSAFEWQLAAQPYTVLDDVFDIDRWREQ